MHVPIRLCEKGVKLCDVSYTIYYYCVWLQLSKVSNVLLTDYGYIICVVLFCMCERGNGVQGSLFCAFMQNYGFM